MAFSGSSYIATASNSNVTPGTDSSKWQLLAQAGATGAIGATGSQGLKGDTGDAGPKGDTGATGSTGSQGAKGDTGATGAAGTAATIAVGTVTTGAAGSSVTVTNAGTSSAAVFNITIPKGDKGDTGSTGAPGNAATISVGTVTQLSAGSTPAVTNAGTSSAAVLNFGIPGSPTRFWSCQPGLGDGLNTIATGTYLQWTCRNDTGSTITLTGISCIADAGSSTVSMTNGAGTALLTSAISCGTSYTAGTQSATTTLASNDYVKLTVAASGSKQVSIDVKGTL
ncbi:MAG: collagen-like protein [Acidobacteria bacterium]|nr:collagen-like protein [Acidobacteriota bacterium]